MRSLLIWQELAYGLILILAVMFMPPASGVSSVRAGGGDQRPFFALCDVSVRFGGLRALNHFLDGGCPQLHSRAHRAEWRWQVHGL